MTLDELIVRAEVAWEEWSFEDPDADLARKRAQLDRLQAALEGAGARVVHRWDPYRQAQLGVLPSPSAFEVQGCLTPKVNVPSYDVGVKQARAKGEVVHVVVGLCSYAPAVHARWVRNRLHGKQLDLNTAALGDPEFLSKHATRQAVADALRAAFTELGLRLVSAEEGGSRVAIAQGREQRELGGMLFDDDVV